MVATRDPSLLSSVGKIPSIPIVSLINNPGVASTSVINNIKFVLRRPARATLQAPRERLRIDQATAHTSVDHLLVEGVLAQLPRALTVGKDKLVHVVRVQN